MQKLFLAIGGALPVCFVLLAIHFLLQRLQPPIKKREMVICFLFGMLSLVITVLIASFFDLFPWELRENLILLGAYDAFIVAGLAEELSRFLVIRWWFGRDRSQLSSTRCLLLGAVVGLGFAAIENPGYCVMKGWSAVWERAVTSVPLHAMNGAIIGYAVGYSLTKRQFRTMILAVIAATLLHGANNFNCKLFYADELPTVGWEAFLITGWPSNILVLLTQAGLLTWLSTRPFGSSTEPATHPTLPAPPDRPFP